MKSTAKRITALVLALVFVLGVFAGCKKTDKKEETTAPEVQTEDEEVAELFEDETKKEDESQEATTDENGETAAEDETKAEKKDKIEANSSDSKTENKSMGKEEAIIALNKATLKASKKSYHWKRVCDYTPTGKIDVGSDKFKEVLNKIINGIAKGETIDSVMGDFLGVGKIEDNVKNGKCAPKMEGYEPYLLKGMSITPADVKQFRAQGDTYYFNLKDCISPEADGKNALHHMTDDFTTPKAMIDLVEGNSHGLIKIDTNKSRSEYKAIILKATIKNGELVNVEFSYKMGANPIALKAAGFTIEGRGEVKVTETYSDFR